MYLFICTYQPWVNRLFLFNLNELGIGEGTQANPKCLKNLKVIKKKPSMVTLTSLVFATVQFSFESKYQSNFLSIFLHLVHHLQPG